MHHLPGKFVWFEHISNNPAKARDFYQALCGWSVAPMPMPDGQNYERILNGADGIGGFRTAQPGMSNHWVSYLSVTDVDTSTDAAKAAGATTVMPPTDFGPVGRCAVITDPTGAALCLWKAGMGDPVDVEKTPFGGWFWNELFSKDAKAAVAFYEKSFGYTHDAMDMGPQGTYYVLKGADGKMRAGIMQQPADMPAPSHWLPYIHVADCDAAATKAAQLGALKTLVPPSDIPNIGRFTVILDPLGAPVALITGA